MRLYRAATTMLVLGSLSLLSCAEDFTAPIDEVAPAPLPVAALPDQKITTLPIDDIAQYIEEMPDGIHLRPGVEIFQIDEELHPFVEISRHSNIVKVHGPAVEYFAQIEPKDGVFMGDYGFIVEGVTYEHDLITFEVSSMDLSKLIWGNFRIEFTMNALAYADQDEEINIDPIIDEFGNVSRLQAVGPSISSSIGKSWTVGGSGSVSATGSLKTPIEFKGVFEGRIGRFKREYVCKNDRSAEFCVDRIAVYAELTVDYQAKIVASTSRTVEWSDDVKLFPDRTLARVPLGATGLSIDPILFGKMGPTVSASGTVNLTYNYNFYKKIPVGFEYRNLPVRFADNEGLFTIPNGRFPITGSGGSHNFSVTGDVSLTYNFEVSVGIKFALSAAGGVAKMVGPEVKGVLSAKTEYRPYSRDTDGYCLKSGVSLIGKATAKLSFEVDLYLWEWKTDITCDRCELSTRPWNLIGPETTDRFCMNRPQFNTLVIEPQDGSPAGYNDVPGYDVDSICLSRTRNGRRSEWCATGGPSQLRGRPDSTCPLQSGKVAGLTSRTEVTFPVPVEPGDRIVVVQTNNPGACNGSGRARFSLKSGNTTKMLGDGAYFERNATITVPQ